MEQTQENNEQMELTPEQMKATARMQQIALSNLVGIHIDSFSAIMVNGNGVSYAEKLQAATALKEAILFALDFGLDVSKKKIRQSGKLAKEVNNLAAVTVKALDNRMLLLAAAMKEQEDMENKQLTENESVEENKGENNE